MRQLTPPQEEQWENFWRRGLPEHKRTVAWSKRRMIQKIAPFLIKGKKILEAGCGSGFFSEYFSREGLETIAVDYSQAALVLTQRATRAQVKTRQLDLIKEKLSDHLDVRVDIIFSDGLLEHFLPQDQDRLLQNLLSVLKEEGLLITFVPNRWSPWEIIRPLYMPGIDEKPFILSELIELHVRHKLLILQKGGINTLPLAFSPEGFVADHFGMLLFVIAQKVCPSG